MAEFFENITSWIDSKGLEACVMRHRTELPRVSDALYVDVIDLAGQHRAEIKEFSRRLVT